MNWDDVRFLLAVARTLTLRGAARDLHVDQATVGRRIAAMEQALGSVLFLRTSGGYLPTAAGESALAAAEGMERAAIDLVQKTKGKDSSLSGQVRLSTTDLLAVEFVMPAIAQLHRAHPEISVSLETSSHLVNVSRRETDIAIRPQKPINPDLFVRRLARWPVGLFAAPGYLERHGEPRPGTAFEGHDLVVCPHHTTRTEAITFAGEHIRRGRVVVEVGSSMMARRAIADGLGLGELPLFLGDAHGLVRVWPNRKRSQPYEVWMVTHQDLRHTARIRVMIEHLEKVFPV